MAWNADGAASMGAAIAYYTIFSIAPLLVITMAIAGFFFGAEAAQGQIYAQARSLLGEEGATALQGLVQSASKPAEGVFATVVSLLFMVLGASGCVCGASGVMDRIWQGSKTGPAKLVGKLRGNRLVMTITWGGLVNGDRTAQMVLERTGPDSFAQIVNDTVEGKKRSTSNFAFVRRS